LGPLDYQFAVVVKVAIAEAVDQTCERSFATVDASFSRSTRAFSFSRNMCT